jgi:broad specificity phosphatase PhoE
VYHLLLLRHAESEWNATGRWQGWADPDLSPRGRKEAAAVAASMAALPIEVRASSDLRRARRTAELVTADLPPEVPTVVDPGLRERDVGDWSGLTREEIEEGWPGQIEAWTGGKLVAPPGGETSEAMLDRVTASLTNLADTYPGRCALVVTHGGVIRILERSLGLSPRPVANLSGRWFGFVDGRLDLGDTFAARATDLPSTT